MKIDLFQQIMYYLITEAHESDRFPYDNPITYGQFQVKTRIAFDRDTPRNLEFGLWFMDFGLLL